ncbi:MAG: hypothetical protein AAF447_02275 [Myxococcota bacterium]
MERCRATYFRGEALFAQARHLEAAADYIAARDGCRASCLGADAAYRVIRSLEQHLGADRGEGPPPPATGDPPRVPRLTLSTEVRALYEARGAYIRLVPEGRTPWWPDMHASLRYENALIDRHHGRQREAQEVFDALVERGCVSEDFHAQKLGFIVWRRRRRNAVARADYAEARRMGEALTARHCHITPMGLACESDAGRRALCAAEPSHSCCLADGTDPVFYRVRMVREELGSVLTSTESPHRDEQLRYVTTLVTEVFTHAPLDYRMPGLLTYVASNLEDAGYKAEALRNYQRLQTVLERQPEAGRERMPELERVAAERIRVLIATHEAN